MQRFVSWRRVVVAAGILAGLTIVLVLALHTGPARRSVVSWIATSLARSGIILSVDRLDYNLLSRSATLHGVRLTARDRSLPFFTAEQVRLSWPWSVLSGPLQLDSVEISRGRVTVQRDEAGVSNLPASDGSSSEPASFPVSRLLASDFEIHVDDRPSHIALDLAGIRLALDPSVGTSRGTLTIAGPSSFRWQDQQVGIRGATGGVAFNGRDVILDALRVDTADGELTIGGLVEGVLGSAKLALTYQTRIRLDAVAARAKLTPLPSGIVTIGGRLDGAAADLGITAQVGSEGVRWEPLGPVSLAAKLALVQSAVAVDALRVDVAGGRIEGTARVGTLAAGGAASTASRARLQLTGVDAGTLMRVMPSPPAVQLAATIDGSIDLEFGGPPRATSSGPLSTLVIRADLTTQPSARSAGLRLRGPFDLLVQNDRWRAAFDQQGASGIRIDGTLAGRVATPISSSSVAGPLTIRVPRLDATLVEARSARLLTGAAVEGPIAGQLLAELTVNGTLARPVVEGPVTATDATYGAIGPLSGRADLALRDDALAFRGAAIALPEGSVNGDIGLNLRTQALSGQVSFKLTSLGAFLPPGVPVAIEGPLDGVVQLAGRLGQPSLSGDVRGGPLRVAGQRFDAFHASLGFVGGVVRVTRLEAAGRDAGPTGATAPTAGRDAGPSGTAGTLTATGEYEIGTGRYVAKASARALTLRDVELTSGSTLPISGRFDIDLDAVGTLDDPAGTATVRVVDGHYGDRPIGRASVTIAVKNRRATLTAELPDVHARVSGDASLVTPFAYTATVQLDGADLADLIARTGTTSPRKITGTVTANADVRGRLDDLATSSVDARIERLQASVDDVPVTLQQGARIRYGSGVLAADGVDLRTGATSVRLDGTFGSPDGSLTARVEGTLADLQRLAALVPGSPPAIASLGATGSLRANLVISGAPDAPVAAGTLELNDARLAIEGHPPLEHVTASMHLADGLATIDRITAQWQGAAIEAHGLVPLGLFAERLPAVLVASLPGTTSPATLEARITGLTQAALASYVSPTTMAKLDARVDASLSLSADRPALEAVRGTLQLDQAAITVSGITMAQRGPSRVELDRGRAFVRRWQWTGPTSSLTLDGSAGLSSDAPIDLTLAGEVDLRLLSLFVPAATAGRASLVAAIGGSLGDPRVDGEVAITGGELRLTEPRVVVSGLAGTLQLTRDRLTSPKLAGTANGGPVTITVDVHHSNLSVTEGRVTLVASTVPLQPIQGLRTEVDASLDLQLGSAAPVLHGTITIARGGYREPLTIIGQLLQRTRDLAIAMPAGGAGAGTSALDDLRLDVSIVTKEDVLVSNNVANLAVGLDVTLVGTLARPALVGRADVREGGTIALAGNIFQIESGSIDFSNPSAIEPQLNITARTRLQSEEITLRLSGTPDTMTVDLTSDTGMSEGDVIAMLLTGRKGAQGAMDLNVARDQAIGLLTGDFLAVAGRAVGLDLVRFERGDVIQNLRSDPGLVATETDPTSRLTIAKNLRRDVELVFSQSLRRSGRATWIVSYTPRANLEVRGVSRDNNDRSYEFRHDISFGGGSSGRPPSRTRARSARVGLLRITGTPGFSESEIRKRLRIADGDRFDFYKWQQDRDRLLRFYQDAGYRQAQVQTRRSVRPGAGSDDRELVDLEFEIVRGPLAVLVVEGMALPRAVQDDLERLWNDSILDSFLVEEAQDLIRQHLARQGYLRATVVATSRLSPDRATQTLNVVLDPGPKSDRFAVQTTGNENLSTGRIEALADRPESWHGPDTIREAITDLYRRSGWLDAVVSVSDVVYEGGTATLPVKIVEGPQYHVGEVAVTPPTSRPAAEIVAAAGVRLGSVYTPAVAADARRAIEADYRQLGFNTARVVVSPQPDATSATVTLAVAVSEGAQQRIARVEIDAGMTTRRTLAARALGIELQAPVDFAALYRGRQRLFSLGVFRRVDFDVEPEGDPVKDATGREVQPVVVRVDVEEWPAYRLRYGFGINDERSFAEGTSGRTFTPGLVGELTRRNLFGRAITAGLSTRLERRQQIARTFIGAASLFGLPISSNVFLSRIRNKFGENTQRPGIRTVTQVSLEQRFSPLPRTQVSYGYIYERNRTAPVNFDPDDDFSFPVTIGVARLAASLAYDSRDDPFNATRGWFHASTIEYSSERLGSVLRFAKYLGQVYIYRPLGTRVVFASALRLGFADAFGQVLIPSERFFAGGGNTVRGYAEDAVGPSDFFGALGGDALLILNEEVRFPIWRWVRGVGFVDAGAAFARLADLDVGGLAKSVGAGLRLDTPIGLFRIDYGLPLSRQYSERRGLWFFSIGQMF